MYVKFNHALHAIKEVQGAQSSSCVHWEAAGTECHMYKYTLTTVCVKTAESYLSLSNVWGQR